MKDHPILFSGEMVRAILENRKTQTRRVVTPQPDEEDSGLDATCLWYAPTIIVKGMEEPGPEVFGFSSLERGWKCPYGAPGDRLWVRETWGYACGVHGKPPECDQSCIGYRADNDNIDEKNWRPSIFMPRWASRIVLEIVKVRVERLQVISHEDVIAEGGPFGYSGSSDEDYFYVWDQINGKRGFYAYTNPWVWVIEFRKVTS